MNKLYALIDDNCYLSEFSNNLKIEDIRLLTKMFYGTLDSAYKAKTTKYAAHNFKIVEFDIDSTNFLIDILRFGSDYAVNNSSLKLNVCNIINVKEKSNG